MIGVYEPLVLVAGGLAKATSLASEPAASLARGEHYHGQCYGEPGGDGPNQNRINLER